MRWSDVFRALFPSWRTERPAPERDETRTVEGEMRSIVRASRDTFSFDDGGEK
jgi:hypothetical protein